jgi:hypothetical protein
MKFYSLDVETANPDMSTICQIGVGLFDEGILVETWKTYIDPRDYFHWRFTRHTTGTGSIPLKSGGWILFGLPAAYSVTAAWRVVITLQTWRIILTSNFSIMMRWKMPLPAGRSW